MYSRYIYRTGAGTGTYVMQGNLLELVLEPALGWGCFVEWNMCRKFDDIPPRMLDNCCLEPFVHALLVLKAEERTDIYYLCMKRYSLLRWYFATATAVRYSGSSVSIGSACVDVTQ